MLNIKSFSVNEINKTEGKTGEPVWQTDTIGGMQHRDN